MGLAHLASKGWYALVAPYTLAFFTLVAAPLFYLVFGTWWAQSTCTEHWGSELAPRGRSRTHVGDVLAACIPCAFSAALLIGASEAAAGSTLGTGGALLAVMIPGYSWGGTYFFSHDVLAGWRAQTLPAGCSAASTPALDDSQFLGEAAGLPRSPAVASGVSLLDPGLAQRLAAVCGVPWGALLGPRPPSAAVSGQAWLPGHRAWCDRAVFLFNSRAPTAASASPHGAGWADSTGGAPRGPSALTPWYRVGSVLGASAVAARYHKLGPLYAVVGAHCAALSSSSSRVVYCGNCFGGSKPPKGTGGDPYGGYVWGTVLGWQFADWQLQAARLHYFDPYAVPSWASRPFTPADSVSTYIYAVYRQMNYAPSRAQLSMIFEDQRARAVRVAALEKAALEKSARLQQATKDEWVARQKLAARAKHAVQRADAFELGARKPTKHEVQRADSFELGGRKPTKHEVRRADSFVLAAKEQAGVSGSGKSMVHAAVSFEISANPAKPGKASIEVALTFEVVPLHRGRPEKLQVHGGPRLQVSGKGQQPVLSGQTTVVAQTTSSVPGQLGSGSKLISADLPSDSKPSSTVLPSNSNLINIDQPGLVGTHDVRQVWGGICSELAKDPKACAPCYLGLQRFCKQFVVVFPAGSSQADSSVFEGCTFREYLDLSASLRSIDAGLSARVQAAIPSSLLERTTRQDDLYGGGDDFFNDDYDDYGDDDDA